MVHNPGFILKAVQYVCVAQAEKAQDFFSI